MDYTPRMYENLVTERWEADTNWTIHPEVYEAWVREHQSQKIFPNLNDVYVHWGHWGEHSYSLLSALAGSNTRVLTLQLPRHCDSAKLQHFVHHLHGVQVASPYMNSLNLKLEGATSLSVELIEGHLEDTIARWTSLTALSVTSACSKPTMITATSNLPNLRSLDVHAPMHLEPGGTLSFPSLQTVWLDKCPMSFGIAFLSRISSRLLKSFTLLPDNFPPCPASIYVRLLTLLARHPHLSTIDINSWLDIDDMYIEDHLCPPAELRQIIDPILKLSNLSVVGLGFALSISDHDSDAVVHTMSAAWPNLTKLVIQLPRCQIVVSFSTFQHLLRVHPKLDLLQIWIDLLSPLPAAESEITAPALNSIECLYLTVHGDITASFDAQAVATFLRKMCPRLAWVDGKGTQGVGREIIALPQVDQITELLFQQTHI